MYEKRWASKYPSDIDNSKFNIGACSLTAQSRSDLQTVSYICDNSYQYPCNLHSALRTMQLTYFTQHFLSCTPRYLVFIASNNPDLFCYSIFCDFKFEVDFHLLLLPQNHVHFLGNSLIHSSSALMILIVIHS